MDDTTRALAVSLRTARDHIARDNVCYADDSMRALCSIVVPTERLRAARAVAQMLDGGRDSGLISACVVLCCTMR